MKTTLITYQDAIDHVLDYLGAATDQANERFARRAILLGLNEFWSVKNWSYFNSRDRINTVAPYDTGTVEFDLTGGSVERQVTLTGGTWPTWAGDGSLIIGSYPYNVQSRISNSVIQLSSATSPPADIAAGQVYKLARDRYTLPVDFGAMGEIVNMIRSWLLVYTIPDQMLMMQRTQNSPASPRCYSILGDPRRYGTLALWFYPPPDQVYSMDFTYRRRPRDLNVPVYSEGTATITNGSLVLSGTATTWRSTMVGAVIRFSNNADVPTGNMGANPFYIERTITAFSSANSMTIDQDPLVNMTNVKYAISDPVDMETGAMMGYFFREIERQARMIRRMKSTADEERQYNEAMLKAMEADSRSFQDRSTFSDGVRPVRMASMPSGADI